MKRRFSPQLVTLALSLIRGAAFGQGTVIFDQQSSTDETAPPLLSYGEMQAFTSPWGQSFTPSLFSISFIRLKFADGNVNDGRGAVVYLNLRSDSISGPLLATTGPVQMAPLFRGVAEFTFATPVSVVPGTSYYFEPVLQSGGTWNIVGTSLYYPGGSVWDGGAAVYQSDLWFREGILVPEPSATALGLLGAVILFRSRTGRGPKPAPNLV